MHQTWISKAKEPISWLILCLGSKAELIAKFLSPKILYKPIFFSGSGCGGVKDSKKILLDPCFLQCKNNFNFWVLIPLLPLSAQSTHQSLAGSPWWPKLWQTHLSLCFGSPGACLRVEGAVALGWGSTGWTTEASFTEESGQMAASLCVTVLANRSCCQVWGWGFFLLCCAKKWAMVSAFLHESKGECAKIPGTKDERRACLMTRIASQATSKLGKMWAVEMDMISPLVCHPPSSQPRMALTTHCLRQKGSHGWLGNKVKLGPCRSSISMIWKGNDQPKGMPFAWTPLREERRRVWIGRKDGGGGRLKDHFPWSLVLRLRS